MGFGEMAIEDIGAQVRPSLRRLHLMARLLGPGAHVLHRAGLRSATAQNNLRGARDQYRALRRHLWYEAILTATAPAA
jgi:hypothetical protein